MRRNDREAFDGEIDGILRRGRVLHLGLQDGEWAYVVPVNYGFAVENGKRVLYFHGAASGKKLDLLRQVPSAAFCVDLDQGTVSGEQACSYSFRYESVLGRGVVTELRNPEEKRRGLSCIFAQYAPGEAFAAPDGALEHTAVLRLEVTACTGKRRT